VRKRPELTEKLQTLLIDGVRRAGSYLPDNALPFVEESMTADEYENALAFLNWVNAHGKKFGHGNLQKIWAEWRKSK
jgi:hypothetical protein